MRRKRAWLRRYQRVFGWRGLFYFIYAEILGRRGEVAVTVPECRSPIYLRLGTSDVGFCDEIFMRMAYALPLERPLRVIVDAGANIGLTSLYYANQYPDARILALEPASANFSQLCKNVTAYPQITPIRAALWDRLDQIAIVNPLARHGTFQIWGGNDPEAVVLEHTPTMTVVDLLSTNGLTMIDLLKIDIEGAEVEVFAAPSAWINMVSVIVIELHDCFRRGCSLNFYNATQNFEDEWHQGELVIVAREGAGQTD